MGFVYALGLLCCDFCDHNHLTKPSIKWVKKIPCPYGYCQAWAVCDQCHSKGKHKEASMFVGSELSFNHQGCKLRMDKERLENALELAVNDADFNLQESIRGELAGVENNMRD